MTSLLDVMYYYALFNYDRDNNSSEDDDNRVERLSKEDVALIPEMKASVAITHPVNPQEPPPLAAAKIVSTSSARTTSNRNSASEKKVAAAATCAICLSSYNEGDILKILPNCHHIFHIDCIIPWLTEHSNLCPLCRLPVVVCNEEGYGNKNKRMRSYFLGTRSFLCEPTCSIQ